MSKESLQARAQNLGHKNYTPSENPFWLGRQLAKAGIAPNQRWPERVVAGWQFQLARTLQGAS